MAKGKNVLRYKALAELPPANKKEATSPIHRWKIASSAALLSLGKPDGRV